MFGGEFWNFFQKGGGGGWGGGWGGGGGGGGGRGLVIGEGGGGERAGLIKAKGYTTDISYKFVFVVEERGEKEVESSVVVFLSWNVTQTRFNFFISFFFT